MTTDEARVTALAWEVRLSEGDQQLWFAVDPELLPAAHGLAEKGWLERRASGPLPEWRLTDQGLQTLRTDTVRQTHSSVN